MLRWAQCQNPKFSIALCHGGKSKIARLKKFAPRKHKGFDVSNFSALRLPHFRAGGIPALLRIVMSTLRTNIATTAAGVRPFVRLADWQCMSAAKLRPNSRLEAKLIREARV
jgi:hypothetical protein